MKLYSRRNVLRTLPPTIVASAGCAELTSTDDTPVGTPDGTATESGESVKAFLPAEDDGWSRIRKEDRNYSNVGGEDGVYASYESSNDVRYDVLIAKIKKSYDVRRKARHWKCDVEWQVVLRYEELIIAAGTGTAQKTFTPEEPPQMDRTPVPDTGDEIRELLATSARLDPQDVDEYEVTDEDCRRG
jgi:hypothetical protein